MKVSLSWLSQYVAIDMSVEELVDALTMVGLEVETVSDRYAYLASVVVGRIVRIDAHPHADRLKICQVDIGDRVLAVVCGAPNVQTEMQVPLALPGTVFPDGSVLEKTTIRGVPSDGMICSAVELGLGSDASGVMSLDAALKTGTKLAEALGLNDKILDIDLTPNRPDCLSIIGVAREIAAIQQTDLTYPDFHLEDAGNQISDLTSVTIEAPEHCPRYAARLVTDITVAPSPFWLQDRLMSVGLRPINNIVDITNFVMMETGQPLHAFDFDRLAENRIVVRTATQGEKFITLDEKERDLSSETLMICDGEKPVAIGGVMGGLNSEIEDSTTRVLIESAYFNPVSIRKTAKKLGLNTEATHRFERGVDPEGTLKALNRAARLMADLGGRIVEGLIDQYPAPATSKTVELHVSDTNRLLGTDLNRDQIRNILESIEFTVDPDGPETLVVRPPSFRVDITRPVDLMEEVARLSGYNNIPTTFPVMPAETREASKLMTSRSEVKRLMAGFGFAETINYSFVHRQSCDRLRLEPGDPRRKTIAILNPLSEDQAVMRTSLVPGLLETMGRNISRQEKNLRLFEVGKIYRTDGRQTPAREIEMIAALWTGSRFDAAWHVKETACDFFDLKGVAEGLLRGLGVTDWTFTAMSVESCRYTKPGHTARIIAGDTLIGLAGEVHPRVLDNFGLKQTAFIFELDMDRLIALIPDKKLSKPIPKFPAVFRDITLIIDRDVEAASVLQSVESQGEELVESLQLFDVYQGDPIPAGKKSISFRITYRSSTKTLEDDVVNTLHGKITGRLIKAFDAGLPA